MNWDFVNPLKNADFRQKVGTAITVAATAILAALINWIQGLPS